MGHAQLFFFVPVRGAMARRSLWIWAGCLLPLLVACSDSPRRTASRDEKSTIGQNQTNNGDDSPAEILQRLATAYQQAKRYDDRGYIELSYRDGDQIMTDRGELAVSFQRPNRLTVRAYKATLSCDGERFRAWIRDEDSNHLDGQQIDRPAPAQLRLRDLFGDPLLVEQMSNAVLDVGAARTPLQLDLLLAEEGLQMHAAPGKAASLVGQERVEGHSCWKIDVPTEKGTLTLWIDSEQSLLRRMRFPRESLIGQLAGDANLRDVALTAHFRDATFERQEAGPMFAIESPRAKHRVRYFVKPPQPLPSRLFGQTVGNFTLTPLENPFAPTTSNKADGAAAISPASLRDKPAVLMWFHDHPACEMAVKQLDQVWRTLRAAATDRANPAVAFFGVCTEPSSIADREIQELARRWQIELPLARDLAAHGRDVLAFTGSPALLVLNGVGAVQIVEIGANPNLEKELPLLIEKLTRGEDLAAEVLQNDERERLRYVNELARATGDEDSTRAAPTAGSIYPETAPRVLGRTPLWQAKELKSPGNMAILLASPNSRDPSRLFIVESPRTLVELSDTGSEVVRIPLDLPPTAVVGRIRVWRDAQQAIWFACEETTQSRVYLFDAQGRRGFALPPIKGAVRLANWEWIDDEPQGKSTIAVASDRGLDWFPVPQSGPQPTRDGKAATWLTVAPDFSTTASPALTEADSAQVNSKTANQKNPTVTRTKHRIWVGDELGRPCEFQPAKGRSAPRDIQGWKLEQMRAHSFPGNTAARFAALAVDRQEKQALVAFDADFKEQWNYPLPAAAPQDALERLQAVRLFRDQVPFWMLAAADGTLHFVSADGRFSDFMSCGEPLTGWTCWTSGDESLVLTATRHGLTCWKVTEPRTE